MLFVFPFLFSSIPYLSTHNYSGTNHSLGPSNQKKNLILNFEQTNEKKTHTHKIKVRAGEDENLLEPSGGASDSLLETIRVARETNTLNNNDNNNKINNDQEAQASDNAESKKVEDSPSSVDELTLDSLEDDENRGKRFVFMIDVRKIAPHSLINYESKQIFKFWRIWVKWAIKRPPRRFRKFLI